MADTNGRAKGNLTDSLLREAWNYDFFRALRLLEQSGPESSRIGYDNPPKDEIIRLRPDASFKFPPSAISKLTFENTASDLNKKMCMTITFFGLYGRYGTLPWHYTSRIIHVEHPAQRDKRRPDNGLRPFFDIFNHRLLSLFYRAGIKYRWPLIYRPGDGGDVNKKGDDTTRNFIAFTGLGTRHLVDKSLPFPDGLFLRYAGLFITPRSASSLATLLSDILGVQVRVYQFQGEWLKMEEDDYNRIGSIKGNNRLGYNFTIGRRIFSRQHKFSVAIGPIDFEQFINLLPAQKLFDQVCTIVRLYSSMSLKYDCQLIVTREKIPGIAIGKKLACLGRTFFLVSRKRKGAVTHPVFSTGL